MSVRGNAAETVIEFDDDAPPESQDGVSEGYYLHDTPASQYWQQREEFWQEAAKHAFDRRDTVYMPPWVPLRYANGEWSVDYSGGLGSGPPEKYDVRDLRVDRPKDWKSAYPRVDHRDWPELFKPMPAARSESKRSETSGVRGRHEQRTTGEADKQGATEDTGSS
jgi:hypothetical protein